MPNVNEAFPSEWLKPVDLQGKAYTLTVKAYEQGSYMGNVQHILHFYETKKKLGLNKGTAQQIAEYLGESEMTKWADKKITLFSNRENQKGEWREVIRCQMTSPINEARHVTTNPPTVSATIQTGGSVSEDDVPF